MKRRKWGFLLGIWGFSRGITVEFEDRGSVIEVEGCVKKTEREERDLSFD